MFLIQLLEVIGLLMTLILSALGYFATLHISSIEVKDWPHKKEIMAKHPNPISSHVLDTTSGLPAPGIGITFEKFDEVNNDWIHVVRKETNEDGRSSGFLTWEEFETITYRMRFETKEYFQKKGQETFYPYAEVVFEIKDSQAHYHIPLLLSPYGYTTYRGS